MTSKKRNNIKIKLKPSPGEGEVIITCILQSCLWRCSLQTGG